MTQKSRKNSLLNGVGGVGFTVLYEFIWSMWCLVLVVAFLP